MTLFKRHAGRYVPEAAANHLPGPWSFKFTHDGRQYFRTTETVDKPLALQVAKAKRKAIIEAIIRQNLDEYEATKTRHVSAGTIDQILALYPSAPVSASPSTRRANLNALRAILEGHASSCPTSSIAILNRDLWKLWKTARARLADAAPDQRAAASIKRSANSIGAMARSIFIPAALEHYRDHGLDTAKLRDFYDAFDAYKFTDIPARAVQVPSEDAIRSTLADWEKLEDRNLFLAIGHELAFGLRKSEIAQARWNWWTERNGHHVLDTTMEGHASSCPQTKDRTGLIQVMGLDPWFTTMRLRVERENWHGGPRSVEANYILEGSHTLRTDTVFRDVSAFLRDHGWATQKTNHALRDYAGSLVQMKFGVQAAKTWLRHKGVQVTEGHYSSFVDAFKIADPASIPIEWAVAKRAFEPKVVSL